MRLQITCDGEHAAHVTVGMVDVPDDAPQSQQDQATSGFLCEDCGNAYPVLMQLSMMPVGQWPSLIRSALLSTGGMFIRPDRPSAVQVNAILGYIGKARKLPR